VTHREVVELVTDYMEGALSARDRDRFEDHIAGCDGCRAYVAQLRTTTMILGQVAIEPIPEGIHSELLRAFRDWKSARS
jgi:anti-sigma factor RsiW